MPAHETRETGAVLIRNNPVRMFKSFADGLKYVKDVYHTDMTIYNSQIGWTTGYATIFKDGKEIKIQLQEMPITEYNEW